MAQKKSKRGARLTPEQAQAGQQWIRLTVLAAVIQAWMIVTVMALFAPHHLLLILALGAVYSLSAPFLLRYLNHDIDRRVDADDRADSLVYIVHAR